MGAGLATTVEEKKSDSSRGSGYESPRWEPAGLTPSSRGVWGDNAGDSSRTSGSSGAPSGIPLFLQPQVQMKCAECEKEENQDEGSAPKKKCDHCEEEDRRVPPVSVQKKCAHCEEEEKPEKSTAGVQAKCAACEAEGLKEHSTTGTALDGVASANRSLPHLDRIQGSFGHHDISGARAAVGGSAAEASGRMGALAYTAGDRVAFRSEPDVNLAAHEAAHVVQQRNGAKLPGGVGRPGDEYEQQADDVAEITARGGSAEHILDRQISRGETGAPPVVQHRLAATAERILEAPSLPDAKEAAVGGTGEFSQKGTEPKAKAPVSKKGEKKDEEEFGKGVKKSKPASPVGPSGGSTAQSAPGGSQASGGSAPANAPSSQPGGPGLATNAPGQNAPAQPGPAPTGSDQNALAQNALVPAEGTAGGGTPQPGNAAPACTGKGKAEPYTDDTPDPRDQEKPPESEPPATKVKEESSADVPDVVEPDVCPADKALSKTPAANAAAPGAGGAAPGNAAAGPSGAVAPSGPAGAAAAAAKAGLDAKEAAVPTPAPPAPPISIGSPLEGAVASAEGQRNRAAASFFGSSASLEAVSSRTAILRDGTRFGPGDTDLRSAASARADRFFGNVADQLDTLISLVKDGIPDRLDAKAEAAKAQIATSIDQQKGAISARVAGAKRQARGEAAGAIHMIAARAAAVANNARTQTTSAIESLKASHAKAASDIDKQQTTTLARVNEVYADGRVAQEQLGVKIGNKCIERGNEFAAAYEKFKINKRDSIMKGHLTDRRAEAQMNAATETATAFRKQIIEAAKRRALDTTKAGRKQQRCAVIAAARASHSTIDSQLAQLVQSLEAARDGAIRSAAHARDSQIASVRGALQSTIAQFGRQEHEQRQAADDTGFIQQVTQEQAAMTAAAGLQQGVVQAVNEATTALSSVQARFSATAPPDPELLDGALSGATAKISSMLSLLRTNLDAGAVGGESQLDSLSRTGLSALDGVTSGNNDLTETASGSFTGSIRQITGGAAAAFAGMERGFTKQARQSAKDGDKALSKAAEGMEKACTNVLTECDKDIAKNTKELEANLLANKQEMECEIPKKAMEAAAKERPAWKTVLAVFLIIVVVIIMVVATVVTFGAGGVVAGIIVGAIVGAVTSGMIYAITTLWTNRSWSWSEFGKQVGLGALTGAIGGGLGAWTGGLVKGMHVGVKLATAVGISVVMDVGTQFFTHHMSFKNFNWIELGAMILIAGVTFGIGHKYGGRIQIGGGKGSGAPAVAEPSVTTPKEGAPVTTPQQEPPVAPPKDQAPVTTPKQEPPVAPPKDQAPVTTPKQEPPIAPPKEEAPVTTPKEEQTEPTAEPSEEPKTPDEEIQDEAKEREPAKEGEPPKEETTEKEPKPAEKEQEPKAPEKKPWELGSRPKRYGAYRRSFARKNPGQEPLSAEDWWNDVGYKNYVKGLNKRSPGKPPLSRDEWYAKYGSKDPHNPYGGPGDPDHQGVVDQLRTAAETEYPAPQYKVISNQEIPVPGGVRKPDVTVIDTGTGKVVKVYEAARFNSSGTFEQPYEAPKIVDYDALGIPYEFHPVGSNKPPGGVLKSGPP